MLSSRHGAPLCAVFALLILAVAAWPFTVDDAYIVARYADRIVRGEGYTFSGPTRSDGVTGPLWLVPLLVAASLRVDVLAAAKCASLAAGVVAGWLAVQRARTVALGGRAGWLAVLVLVSSLSFVVWSSAGLETGLAALFATALALAVTRRPEPAGWQAGACAAALAWLRPELLAFAYGLLALLFLHHRRAAHRAALLALPGLLAVLAFRYALFGHWLPMSASAKPATLDHGLAYLGATLLRPRVWLLVPLLLYTLARGSRSARVLAVALVVHAAAVLLVGGDWMPGRRLFAPVVPVLALALALGTRGLWLRRPRMFGTGLSLLLVASLLELLPELKAVREAGATREQSLPRLAALVCSAPGPVAIVDLGAVGAACPEQTFLDLAGLTEPTIAYARGAHLDKRLAPEWLRAQRPGLIVLHSHEPPRVDAHRQLRWFAGYPVERRVLATFMHTHEVQDVIAYAPHYFYITLIPRKNAASDEGAPQRNAP